MVRVTLDGDNPYGVTEVEGDEMLDVYNLVTWLSTVPTEEERQAFAEYQNPIDG